jgi:hypothetical protein
MAPKERMANIKLIPKGKGERAWKTIWPSMPLRKI